MNFRITIFAIIFSILIIPLAYGQVPTEDSKQKSVEIVIGTLGDVHVKHVIKSLDTPKPIDLLNGTISNLTVKDNQGNKVQFGEMTGNNIIIMPSRSDTIIEYDLAGALIKKDNFWTWDFLYLNDTSFVFPEGVKVVFVNSNPVDLNDKPGIMCHGCKMLLEYSLDEPKLVEKVKIQDKEYLFEINSWAKINHFNINGGEKGLSFEEDGAHNFITVIIPKNFLTGPYNVLLDDEKIIFHKYIDNGTHVWLNFRPENSGQITILGTLIPDLSQKDFSYSLPTEYLVILVVGVAGAIGLFFIKRKKR